MTQATILTSNLGFWVSLFLLFALLYWPVRWYGVDRFRHEMFTLRGELFDLAARGDVAFTDPAYTQLRATMNGFIRFADRLGLLSSVLGIFLLRRHRNASNDANVIERRWEKAVAGLEPGVRAEMKALRERMHFEVFRQLVVSSPLLFLTLIPAAMLIVVQMASRNIMWRLVSGAYVGLSDFFEDHVRAPVDAIAMDYGVAPMA
jgi:hypothetical protein